MCFGSVMATFDDAEGIRLREGLPFARMLPLILLAATPAVHLSRAGRTVPIAVSVDVAGDGVTPSKHAVEWKPDGAGLEGTVAGGGWTLRLKLQPGDGAG